MVVAKTEKVHEELSEMIKRHEVERIYYALVDGVIPHSTGTIDAPIGRDTDNRQKMKVTDQNSKDAVTHFKVLKRYPKNTLIECKLETGRTHQIRVHLAYIGYPIHNDPVYGKTTKTTPFGQYLHAKKRLILLDYDGTLVPFQKRPEDASPTPQLLDTLQKLTADPLNHVVINSGRDHFTLEKWLGTLPLSFAAEHGAFYKENGVWHKNVHAQEWSPGLLSILKLFVSKTPRSHLEVKETALAWHYREADAWLGRLRAQQLVNSLISICLKQNLQIMQGNKVIEIKSPEFTKGSEVNRLLLATRYDFILAMGDDTTDDDMFKALPVTAVTVKIGTASESARYNLPVQTDTLPFLQRLTDKSVVKAALKSGLKGQLSSAIDFLKRIINH